MGREDRGMALNGGKVLVIAGSDSSGGAGIVRDVETIAAFGLKAAIAVTAVTAQSDRRVTSVEAIAPALVAAQMEAALEGGDICAVKIGMLANAGIVAAVSAQLERHPTFPVVLDPVLASSSGRALLEPAGIRLMIERLLPRADLVTPNLPELALLTESADLERAMDLLLGFGSRAALIKGGHAIDMPGGLTFGGATAPGWNICRDLLIRPDRPAAFFDSPRQPGTLRGTGCMLASAIACGLARGEPLEDAIGKAKSHVSAAFLADQSARVRQEGNSTI